MTGFLERALDSLVQLGKTPGLQYLVVNASSILFARCSGLAEIAAGRPMRAATTMMAYSMSKTITAAAVLQLVESHRIGLDDPVARFVDWQPYGTAITVRQLLSHTSGAPNPIPLRWVHAAEEHAAFREHRELMRVLEKHPHLSSLPGTKFAYSNIGYWLLGAVVEQASGRSFTSYVIENVLKPLDITSEEIAYVISDPATHAAGYLERYSLMNLLKRWLINRALIGEYEGRWLRIRDHYPNGPRLRRLFVQGRGRRRIPLHDAALSRLEGRHGPDDKCHRHRRRSCDGPRRRDGAEDASRAVTARDRVWNSLFTRPL